MELTEILKVRKNRNTRDARPFKNYAASHNKLFTCLKKIVQERDEIKEILINSIIIGEVTSIEVYCKDILDAFFKICNPDFYKKTLKDIHKNKYDIDDLIFMHEKSIHPLELISFNQSFQNLSMIDSYFSKVLKIKVIEEIKALKVRKDEKSDIITFDDAEIFEQTDLLFKTRHELVHNPANGMNIKIEDVEKMLFHSMIFIFGLDLILITNFHKHR